MVQVYVLWPPWCGCARVACAPHEIIQLGGCIFPRLAHWSWWGNGCTALEEPFSRFRLCTFPYLCGNFDSHPGVVGFGSCVGLLVSSELLSALFLYDWVCLCPFGWRNLV
jgi:hypothetical protein